MSIVLSRTVPESPRWLIAKGREEEAAAWLYKWHANGDTSDELVAAEILEIKLQLETEETQRRVSKSWRECFATPGDRWRMFISFGFGVIISWTGQSIVSYYNTQILNQAGITGTLQQLGINGGLTIFDFFTACLGAFLAGRMGRRPLLLASYGGMTFFHVIVTALSARYSQTNNAKFGYAVIAFIWCESGFYSKSPPLQLGKALLTRQTSPSIPSASLTSSRSCRSPPVPRVWPSTSSPKRSTRSLPGTATRSVSPTSDGVSLPHPAPDIKADF